MASILALPNLPPACAGSLRDASSARLLALIDQGHEDAFGEIVERHEGEIRRACARRVGLDHAGDVTQQAFLQALMALRSGGGPAEPEALLPWLLLIARNCCIDHLRSSGPETVELSHAIDGVPQPPQIAEQRDHVRRTVDLLQVLPRDQRRALVARELEGRSYEEISAELGATDGGVRQMIFRARSAVRRGVAAVLPLPRLLFSVRGSESAGGLLLPHGDAVVSCIVIALSGCAPFVGMDSKAPARHAPATARHANVAPKPAAPTAPAAPAPSVPALRVPGLATKRVAAPIVPAAAQRRRHPVGRKHAAPVHGSGTVALSPEQAAPGSPAAPAASVPATAPAATVPAPAAPTAAAADPVPPAEQSSPPVTASDVEPSAPAPAPASDPGKVKKNGKPKHGRAAAEAPAPIAAEPAISGSSTERHGRVKAKDAPVAQPATEPPPAATPPAPEAEAPPAETAAPPSDTGTADPGRKRGRGHNKS